MLFFLLERRAKPQHYFSTLPASICLSFCNLLPVHPDLSFLPLFFPVSHQQIYDVMELRLLEADWGLEKLQIFSDGGSL
jgi:hypothetical protein